MVDTANHPHKNRYSSNATSFDPRQLCLITYNLAMDEKSNWSAYILLWSSAITTNSYYLSTTTDNAKGRFIAHLITATTLYFTSLALLSLSAAEEWASAITSQEDDDEDEADPPVPDHGTSPLATRATGFLAGAYVFALPLLSPFQHPIANCLLRVATFFASCKCWDLTVARASKPPLPLRDGPRATSAYSPVWRAADHVRYVLTIFSSMRYASFDIAVGKTAPPPQLSGSKMQRYGPLFALPLAYFFPVAEMKVAAGLVCICFGLEVCHTVVHPRCPDPLFLQPFSASTIAEFWGVRWHQTAQSFLYTLGFSPAKNVVGRILGADAGRAAGLLAAFSLSGLWHAWAGAVLTSPEFVWNQSVGLWGIFMLEGVLVIVERTAFKSEKWRTGWRQKVVAVCFWIFSIESAAVWLRYAEPRTILSLS